MLWYLETNPPPGIHQPLWQPTESSSRWLFAPGFSSKVTNNELFDVEKYQAFAGKVLGIGHFERWRKSLAFGSLYKRIPVCLYL